MSAPRRVPLIGLTCREASRLLSESLDGELSRRERWSLRLHTLLCKACRRFAHQARMLREVMGGMPETLRSQWPHDATLSAERRAQIRRLLRDSHAAEGQN